MEKFKTPRELLAELLEFGLANTNLPCGEQVVCYDTDEEIRLNLYGVTLTSEQLRKRISSMLVALEYMDEFNRLLTKENV